MSCPPQPLNGVSSIRTGEKDGPFSKLAMQCRREFEGVSDYFWKAPRLIEAELKSELEKLKVYYPLNGEPEHDAKAMELRRLRWSLESNLLMRAFPYLMAISNLFSAVSLFEVYCLMLAKEIETWTRIDFSKTPASGRSKIFRYFSTVGVPFKSICLHEQINAAFSFRNCLAHLSGALEWYKGASEIRNIIAEGRYRSREHRERTATLAEPTNYAWIQAGHLGDQLVITNDYSWLVTVYFRDYFADICELAHNVCVPP
jgi:hypothetical protein